MISFINLELYLVEMEEKTFKALYEIYKSGRIYLRGIVNNTKMPYGTVQAIIEREKNLLDSEVEGKNKYFKLKQNINSELLIRELEINKSREFLEKNKNIIPFVNEIRKEKASILIFGSYAKGTNTTSSDLDILVISKYILNL